jgi:hypothetical protein
MLYWGLFQFIIYISWLYLSINVYFSLWLDVLRLGEGCAKDMKKKVKRCIGTLERRKW